ncbi:shikimate 5-dehydrogenase [Prolixibacter bellariivorans]|uniref:Shikimate 5-dehydrogenase n=1 Tax=Prolixibacter bellariivorans TaxID=314319 RepID=A0A5M4AUS2_9BACT|nr:shikimate dehydrogenase [Prolixibacter bellariivorans]GET31695.1 shikimate 5-dehydrogenase [Prolixibacter bellariivorans]
MKQTFGLIGYPLTHSFSKKFFTEKFSRERIDSVYENFEIDNIGKLSAIIRENPTLKGLNVTIPYKQDVFSYLDEVDDAAQEIGAVNTIRVEWEGENYRLHGFNTDIIGFGDSIQPLLKAHHKKALVLGTGGASKAVVWALQKLGLSTVLVSRSPKGEGQISYSDLDKSLMTEYTVIVNTTPLGTYPKMEGAPDIPYQFINDTHLLYDLVYNPEKTLFLKKGEEQGAVIKNGLEMLHGQALAAWGIWTRD